MSVEESETTKPPREYGRPTRTTPRIPFDCLDRRVLEKNGITYTLGHKIRHGDQGPADKNNQSQDSDSDDDDVFVDERGCYALADRGIRREQQRSGVRQGGALQLHRWTNREGPISIDDGTCVSYAVTPLESRYASMRTPQESNEMSPILSSTYADSIMSRFSLSGRRASTASSSNSGRSRPSSQAGPVSFRSVTF